VQQAIKMIKFCKQLKRPNEFIPLPSQVWRYRARAINGYADNLHLNTAETGRRPPHTDLRGGHQI
jgi:hypothetical protein